MCGFDFGEKKRKRRRDVLLLFFSPVWLLAFDFHVFREQQHTLYYEENSHYPLEDSWNRDHYYAEDYAYHCQNWFGDGDAYSL
jgi:hypothetical protein